MAIFLHPSTADITLTGVLAALADPVRLQILLALRAEEGCMSCTEASPYPDLPKSTLSHHFRILREAGLIRTTKRGVENRNETRCADLNKRFPGLLDMIMHHAAKPKPKKRST